MEKQSAFVAYEKAQTRPTKKGRFMKCSIIYPNLEVLDIKLCLN